MPAGRVAVGRGCARVAAFSLDTVRRGRWAGASLRLAGWGEWPSAGPVRPVRPGLVGDVGWGSAGLVLVVRRWLVVAPGARVLVVPGWRRV